MAEVTITYEDIAVGAAEAASGTAAGKQSFCDLPDLFGEAALPKLATLETDYWALDGSWPLFPDTPADEALGLWSQALTGSDNAFAAAQELDVILSSNVTSTGITLYFDPYGPSWCTDLTVAWYRDSTLLDTKVFAPDGPVYFCKNAVTSYNKLVILFRAMSAPDRYLKLFRLKFGRVKIFTPKEYKDLSMYQVASPISDTVEDNPLSVTLRNDGDPVGYIFQTKQPLSVSEGAELIGVWYIDTHDQTGAKTYDLTAICLKGMLARQPNHNGGIYNGTLASVAVADIMGSIPYVLDSTLQSVPLYGWLPIAPPRDNLQQVAFALGAIVDDSGMDHISIRPPDTGAATDNFVGSRAYEKGKVTNASMVTSVSITVHRYIAGSGAEQLFSDALTGSTRLEFSEPYSSLAISGGTITSSGVNYAVITGTGGTVTLTGVKYIHSTAVISKTNATKTSGDTDNPKAVTDMTLVSPYNGQARLDALYDYFLRTRTVSGKVVTRGNYPGQRVTMDTVAGDTVTGNIISIDWSISAHQAAEVVVLADAEVSV